MTVKNVLYSTIIFIFTMAAATAASLEAYVSPDTVSAGETFTLHLQSDSREYPQLIEQPKIANAAWSSGQSQSSRIVNGDVTSEMIYTLTAVNEGMIKIPPLKVMVDNEIKTTPEFAVKVVAASITNSDENGKSSSAAKVAIKDLVFGKGTVLSDEKDFYVGEEIPVEVKLYFQRGLNFQPRSWPAFNLDKVIFRDYSKVNRENNRFAQATQSQENIKGRMFYVYKFSTAFRAIAAGTIKPEANIECEIKVPTQQKQRRQGTFDDDFFDNFWGRSNYRSIPHTVKVEFPELTIKPLPETPDNADYLGLVGNWRVDLSLSSKEFKVGEPFTLKMEISGTGTLETLTAPKLAMDGFRIYPPEIDKTSLSPDGNQRAEVKYVFIPTQPGKKEVKMAVSIFSSPLDKYKTFSLAEKIEVKKSDNAADNAGPLYVSHTEQRDDSALSYSPKSKQTPKNSGILYLKKYPAGREKIPLYLNWLWLYLLLGLGGPAIWLFSEIRYARKEKIGSNPALRRKKSALARRNTVLRALRRSAPDKLPQVIQHEAVPYINDLLNFPPGTTASELADKINNPALAECLHSSGESSYMPGAANMNKIELKKNIIKALSKLSIIICLFLLPYQAKSATEKTVSKPSIPTSMTEALNAYDRGDFSLAANYFRQQLDRYEPDPALLYNLGNCLCQEGELGGALVCFERAHLLEPTDSAITENLNFVRRKLFQPQLGKVNNPGELAIVLRDNLRPDQWLLITATACFAAGLLLTFRRSMSTNKLIVLLGFCGIVLMLSIVSIIYQHYGPYGSENAIITASNAELRSLPSETSGKVDLKLQNGSRVRIIEPRMDWMRVKVDENEGWLPSDQLIRITPGGRIP